MRYKNEGDTRHELKILLAAAVVSVLAAVTAAGLVPRRESAAGEADGQQAYISGDYSYTVKADGTAEITGYSGSGRDITVPGELEGHVVDRHRQTGFQSKKQHSVSNAGRGHDICRGRSFTSMLKNWCA